MASTAKRSTRDERWTLDGLTIVDENGLRVASVAVVEDAALLTAAPELVDALRTTRDNIRSLNAARADKGVVGFDAWLSVVEAALAAAGARS